ncbi:MAG: SDR family NAD(P)-dependent oxidoreductase [Roseateles sp.]|uniref:SDR family NAD(P)-dependent oxidoreductase n=1 Tax=Roseateles sp. TaxID=1971397 RepID=UPI0040361B18
MNLNLSGLTAVVTGGSSGIGAAIVRTLAEEGCHVYFCARDVQRIEAMLASTLHLPGKVSGAAVDVTDQAGVDAWLQRIGSFDIFLANVSALSGNWADAIATDLRATLHATETAIPCLQSSPHAAITYIGSKAGSLAAPGSAPYGATKAAMAHYMKSLSARLLPSVRVNTVSPGDTLADRGFWDKVRVEDPEAYAKVVGRNPMKRLATPDEIARVAAFISSPAASFVAGANWYVDGGSISHVQF